MKTILRDKANFDVLEGFLSALLKEHITVLELLESESNQMSQDLKSNRVDLMVKDSNGNLIIIELQYVPETYFLQRILYGASKAIVENLKIGDCYSNVKKVISITIAYFDIGKGNDYVYHGTTQFQGIHTSSILKICEDNAIYMAGKPPSASLDENVFPEYYLIQLKGFSDVIEDDLDEWLYAFKHSEVLDDFHSYKIDALKDKLSPLKMTEAERKTYEANMRGKASIKDSIETLKAEYAKSRAEGLAKGLAKGTAEGLAQGTAEGLAQGTAEGLTKGTAEGLAKGKTEEQNRIRKKLKKNGMSSDEINVLLG